MSLETFLNNSRKKTEKDRVGGACIHIEVKLAKPTDRCVSVLWLSCLHQSPGEDHVILLLLLLLLLLLVLPHFMHGRELSTLVVITLA